MVSRDVERIFLRSSITSELASKVIRWVFWRLLAHNCQGRLRLWARPAVMLLRGAKFAPKRLMLGDNWETTGRREECARCFAVPVWDKSTRVDAGPELAPNFRGYIPMIVSPRKP